MTWANPSTTSHEKAFILEHNTDRALGKIAVHDESRMVCVVFHIGFFAAKIEQRYVALLDTCSPQMSIKEDISAISGCIKTIPPARLLAVSNSTLNVGVTTSDTHKS